MGCLGSLPTLQESSASSPALVADFSKQQATVASSKLAGLPHGNLAPGWLSRSGKRPLSPNKRDRLEADGTAIIID
jgi:hypothetical protein